MAVGPKILLVGDRPEATDLATGQPWSGHGGDLLRRACRAAGLEWESLGKAFVVNEPGRWEDLYETIEEPRWTKTGKQAKKGHKVRRELEALQQGKLRIVEDIQGLRPNLTVAIGEWALQTLTGLRGVTNYRGSVVAGLEDFKVLVIEDPRHIMPGRFWILAKDLKKAGREGEFPEIRRAPYGSEHGPEFHLSRILEHLGRLHRPQPWTLDVETRAGTLACFAIAYYDVVGTPQGFCVPIQTTSGSFWSHQEEQVLWEAMRAMARVNPMLINQNIEYDIYYLLRYGVEPAGVWMDTMLAHATLEPELPKGLGFLASWYLDDVVYWKDDHREWSGRTSDEALWEYNVKDAVGTLRIAARIDEELRTRGLWEAYHGKA